jgi:hypothetical protein
MIAENMLHKFQQLGRNMTVKVHSLASHFDNFPENFRSFNDKRGEIFHQKKKLRRVIKENEMSA